MTAQQVENACNNYERLKAENQRLRAHLSAIGIVCIGVETKHSQFRRIKCIAEEAMQQKGSGK